MKFKEFGVFLYLRNGKICSGATGGDVYDRKDVISLIRRLNDDGIDHLFILEQAEDEDAHRENLPILNTVCRSAEMPVAGGGFVHNVDHVKDYLYSHCSCVILDDQQKEAPSLLKEASSRFGREKIMLGIHNLDLLFKKKEEVEQSVRALVLFDENNLKAVENLTLLPVYVKVPELSAEYISTVLSSDTVEGMAVDHDQVESMDVLGYKNKLAEQNLEITRFEPLLDWKQMKLNSDGMVPVIVQDYLNGDVLMLAYQNEEAFQQTIKTGKMTYWSRSRNQLWVKGETSGHFQYVKSLTADCDRDTILAKVSQIGAACHTGSRSCFFQDIIRKEYSSGNPRLALEDVYKTIKDRKEHPKEGSHSTDLFRSGLDRILKEISEENTSILLSAKNDDRNSIIYEMSDYLYCMMLLMVEKGITWDDLLTELSYRE